jgi:hypothetical protein
VTQCLPEQSGSEASLASSCVSSAFPRAVQPAPITSDRQVLTAGDCWSLPFRAFGLAVHTPTLPSDFSRRLTRRRQMGARHNALRCFSRSPGFDLPSCWRPPARAVRRRQVFGHHALPAGRHGCRTKRSPRARHARREHHPGERVRRARASGHSVIRPSPTLVTLKKSQLLSRGPWSPPRRNLFSCMGTGVPERIQSSGS